MSGLFSNIAAKFAANNASRNLTGWGAWFLSSWIFDDLLYPAVIGWLGVVTGGAFMASIAIVWSWFWLKSVVASDKEWFSMKVLNKIQKVVFWVVRITKKLSFVRKTWIDKIEFALTLISISCVFDPMICVLYFRDGNKEKSLNSRDRKIFVWSALISNTYWILRSWGVVTVVMFIWKSVMH